MLINAPTRRARASLTGVHAMIAGAAPPQAVSKAPSASA